MWKSKVKLVKNALKTLSVCCVMFCKYSICKLSQGYFNEKKKIIRYLPFFFFFFS